jgi:hypothetical protein
MERPPLLLIVPGKSYAKRKKGEGRSVLENSRKSLFHPTKLLDENCEIIQAAVEIRRCGTRVAIICRRRCI